MARFSLKWLLAGVAFIGFAIAALLNANDTWDLLGTATLFACWAAAAINVWFYGRKAPFSIGVVIAIALSNYTLDGVSLSYDIQTRVTHLERFSQEDEPGRYFSRIAADLVILTFAALSGAAATRLSITSTKARSISVEHKER